MRFDNSASWIGVHCRTVFMLLVCLIPSSTLFAQVAFEDTTESSLFGNISGESWGAAVGDYNNDNWLDIAILNHRERASLYRNNGDSTMSNVMLTAGSPLLLDRFEDHHQAVWSDVDGDGDDDLMYVGNLSSEFRQFYSDGYRLQTTGTRTSNSDAWARLLGCNARTWPQLIDLDQNSTVEPIRCLSGAAFTDVNPPVTQVLELVSEDFDGDLVADIAAVRGSYFVTQAMQVSTTRLEALLENGSWGNPSFTFQASGPVTFNVQIGGNSGTATLSTGTTTLAGQMTVSYDVASSTWTVVYSKTSWGLSYVKAFAPTGVSNVTLVSAAPSDVPQEMRYLKGSGGGTWDDQTAAAGLSGGVLCGGATAADFDNDMDVDLYLVCRNGTENIPNRLYLNNGAGQFTLASSSTGADGVLGANVYDGAGTGDNAITGDFDNDGFVDLFVFNGLSNANLREGGPHQLLRNIGNNNRWVNLRLRGDAPNYDGVEARIVATAGGKSQLRYHDAGLHRYSQDSQRIHFGMGTNTSVDLEIVWQNGQLDTFTNIPTNRFYEISQSNGIQPITPGPVDKGPVPVTGDECGAPQFWGMIDQALFLYRSSCATNTWQVRITAGGETTRYTGSIETQQGGQIANLSAFSLEPNDTVLSTGSTRVDFDLQSAGAGIDGFSFTLDGGACLTITGRPGGAPIILGSSNARSDSDTISLTTLDSCTVIPPVGAGYDDVSTSFWAFDAISALDAAGIAGQCSATPREFCPSNGLRRDVMAKWLVLAKYGANFSPPAASGQRFTDVPASWWAAAWIEEADRSGIDTGFGSVFRPSETETRGSLAVSLVKARYGANYTPPPAVGFFSDLPTSNPAAAYVEKLRDDGVIVVGCNGSTTTFCPDAPVNRAVSALLIARVFGL